MARTAAHERLRMFKTYPNAPVAQCGTCGRTFPDVFPSARCPFEYYHKRG